MADLTREVVDVVVVGAGHNGLVAAALLADAGLDVLVLEQQPEPGGSVRTAELFPGYRCDLFSAIHPLGFVAPALRALGLTDHGLRWTHPPTVLAAARSAHDTVALYPDPQETADALGQRHRSDAQAWLELCAQWRRLRDPLLAAFLGPFPPVGAALRLARALGAAELLRFVRFLTLPADAMARELFAGEHARMLLLGNCMHGDVPVNAPVSGFAGYLLTMLAQDTGFPAPAGGAGALTAALVSRGAAAGAQLRTGVEVTGLQVRHGKVVGVHTAGGAKIGVRRAVVADVSASALYTRLLPPDAVPSRLRADLARYQPDNAVVKVNYAVSEPIPWISTDLRGAGTVHLGADERTLPYWNADLATGVPPERPFVLLGQMTAIDPSRSPAGTESAWAYTLMPQGRTDDGTAELIAERMDDVVEEHAPGFTRLLRGRNLQRPSDLSAANANLADGRIGGTMSLHQELVFRPTPALAGPDTPLPNLFLGSAAIHPGGAVHGACGAAAARAALRGTTVS
ncbi:MAG: NAD(P)/FAD-dependent oxidoreductase, partial [Mycobacteriaceae bacterium]|nr:NAD(P)/FAD-dependent oxidoreductase [Mycobacteriaceae bacterium]